MKKLYILVLLGTVFFLIIQFPHAMLNPGELAEGHQKIKNDCLGCHQPFGGISNEKCISCHKLEDIGKDTAGTQNKTLFHQHFSKQECSACHTEHQGVFPEHPLNGFKHELLSMTIINNCINCHNKPTDNLHTQVSTDCKSCHQNQSWKNPISFKHEMLLNKTNCASCHQSPKDNYHRLIEGNCDKCHNTNKWIPSTFEHSSYFKLDQNHLTTCKTCHTQNNYKLYTCFGCHEHSERNIIAEHNEEGIYNISNCVSCHKSGNEHEIKNDNKSLNENERNKLKDFMKSRDGKDKDDD